MNQDLEPTSPAAADTAAKAKRVAHDVSIALFLIAGLHAILSLYLVRFGWVGAVIYAIGGMTVRRSGSIAVAWTFLVATITGIGLDLMAVFGLGSPLTGSGLLLIALVVRGIHQAYAAVFKRGGAESAPSAASLVNQIDDDALLSVAPSYGAKLLQGLGIPMIVLLAVVAGMYLSPPQGGQSCGWMLLFVNVLLPFVLVGWVLITIALLALPWRSFLWVRIVFIPPPLLLAVALVSLWPACAADRGEAAPPPPLPAPADSVIPLN